MNTLTEKIDFAHLELLRKKTTPEPVYAQSERVLTKEPDNSELVEVVVLTTLGAPGYAHPEAEYLAALRNAGPALLAQARHLPEIKTRLVDLMTAIRAVGRWDGPRVGNAMEAAARALEELDGKA